MSAAKKKIAVVLFNLGGPDSKDAIKPFLMNFFMDRNIVPLPAPLRYLIASSIARRRSKREAGESYGALGDRSPLLENSQAQADALEKRLGQETGAEFKTFVSMRYWHPMAAQIVRDVRDWGADEIVLLPLYPQFSTTTTWSSIENWDKACASLGYQCPASVICCYPLEDGFINASADHIAQGWREARDHGHESPRILFSAHGLPESIIRGGDPYQWQCEETARRIVDALAQAHGIENPDWQICYQSRVGPKKWIGPSTEESLERAAQDGKAVLIYPHAFTQEHVETLVELDIEYRHKAQELGIKGYYRARTVDTHPAFIAGLARLVLAHCGTFSVQAGGHKTLCPEGFSRCCMRAYKAPAQAQGVSGAGSTIMGKAAA